MQLFTEKIKEGSGVLDLHAILSNSNLYKPTHPAQEIVLSHAHVAASMV
jgi:hypothetical protein